MKKVPVIGVAAAIVPAAMIFFPTLFEGGTTRLGTFTLQLLFVLLATVFLFSESGRARMKVPLTGLEIVFLLFLLAAGMHLPFVAYYHDAERCFLFITLYAITYSIMRRLPPRAFPGAALSAIVFTACVQAVWALSQAALRGNYQVRGSFDNPNFMAAFLAAAAGIIAVDISGLKRLPLLERLPEKPRKAFLWLLCLLLTAAILRARSRGGLGAVFFIFLLVLAVRYRWRGLAVMAAAVAALLALPNPFRERLVRLPQDVYAYSRLDMWRGAWRMFLDHLPWGIGLGQYQHVSPRYAFPVDGHWARYMKITDNPHSEPLQLLAEFGLPGAALLLLFAGILIRGSRLRLATNGGERSWWPLIPLGGIAFQALLDFNLHSPPVVLAALVLSAVWDRPSRASDEAPPRLVAGRRGRAATIAGLALMLLFLILAVRTMIGFYLFLKSGGGPVNLSRETASLQAWGEEREPSADLLAKAIICDGDCAAYHAAMGSLALKKYQAGAGPVWRDKAMVELDLAIGLNPGSYLYYGYRADLYLSLRRLGDLGKEAVLPARRELRKASRLHPVNVFLIEKDAALALETGAAGEARALFEEAARLEPCFLRAGYGAARALEILGRIEEARRRYGDLPPRAQECRDRPASTNYERGLVDLDLELVQNRIEALEQPASAGAAP